MRRLTERQLGAGNKLLRGHRLVLSITEGREIWALSDGTPVSAEDAGALRYALQLRPADPGLFPDSPPQSFAIAP